MAFFLRSASLVAVWFSMGPAWAQIGHSDSVTVKTSSAVKWILFTGADSTYSDGKRSGHFDADGTHVRLFKTSGKRHRTFRYQRRYIHFPEGGGDVQEVLLPVVPWRRAYRTHWWK